MNTAQIIRMMDQQLGVLKDLDELLAHDAQAKGAHGVAENCVKALREYTGTMRAACEAAKTMAQHYTTKKAEPAAVKKTPDLVATPIETPEPAPGEQKIHMAAVELPEYTAAKRTKKEKPAAPPAPAEPEDDDLDFLD